MSTMDTSEDEVAVKRAKYLQPDGSEDRGSTGQALTLDKKDKIMAHKYVLLLYVRICTLFKCPTPTDMFVSNMLINQAASVHNCLRSAETSSQNRRKLDKFSEKPIVLKMYSVEYKAEPADLIEVRNSVVETLMGKGNTLSQKAMGNIQTIFALWQLWGERMDEVIYGSDSKIRTKRTATEEPTLVKAKNFGLEPASRNYWSGLMWSLPVQSALCQSMGPLAVAVRLSDSTNDKYGTKWRNTFVRHFSFLPYAQDLAKALQEGNPMSESNKTLLKMLSKIVCVTGARDVQRLAFPPCFLAEYLSRPGTIEEFDFSGHGAFLAYKRFTESGLFKAPKTNHTLQLQQLVFHAMLGTHVEDFGVLGFMTKSTNWDLRSQISPSLIKEDLKIRERPLTCSVRFDPIKIHVYAKMSSAMMQNLLGGGIAPLAGKSVISGFRSKKIPDSLVKYVNAEVGTTGGGLGIEDLKMALKKDTRKACDAAQKDKNAGTVSWRSMETLNEGLPGEIVMEVAQENGVFFHAQPE